MRGRCDYASAEDTRDGQGHHRTGGHQARGARRSSAPRASARSTSRSSARKTGYVTLDPAFMNTASTKSAITFIDGDKGILRYRGIPIEQLAEKSTFVETAYLLIYGNLPNEAQLKDWSKQAHAPLAPPRGHEALLRGLPRHGAPDGDPQRDGDGALELLPGRARRRQRRPARHHHRAPRVEGPHHRGLRLQEVDRAAVRLPEELAHRTARTSST